MSDGPRTRYPAEFRQRAARLVQEARPNHRTEYAAMSSVAQRLGISSVETLRKWVRRAQVDTGQRPGPTTEELAEIKRLKRENFELRRANEILKAASAYFAAAELDRL